MNSNEQLEATAPFPWRYYLKVAIRSRWLFIPSVIVVWAAAVTASLLAAPRFRSETLVLVEPGSANAQYIGPNLSVDLQQRLQSLAEQTLSRPRLVQLINEFHLYAHQSGQDVSDDAVKQMRNDIGIDLTKTGSGGDISAFKISYSGRTPDTAQKVTTALASLFIQDSLNRQQLLSDQTTSFLAAQLDEARQDVEQQESLVRQFRSRNLGELPEQRMVNLQILSGLQDRARSATESLHQAEKQRLYLRSLMGWSGTDAAPSDSSPAAASGIDEQIDKMKAELAALKSRYTARHPDVVHLQEQIENAENVRSQMQANPSLAAQVTANDRAQRAASPVAQLQGQFKANELEITNRKQEIRDLEKQIALYQARLNQAPVTEQQMADANRNYEQARTHYESLLAKKQQSEMATDLSRRQNNAQFRTIDPPTLPQRPYSPNRLKFAVIGVFFGVLLGFISIAVKEAVDPRIHGEDDLGQLVQVPVIATVPPLITKAEQKVRTRKRNLEIAIVLILFLMVPVLSLMVQGKG